MNSTEQQRLRRQRGRKAATAFVEAINSVTFCARCGAQPIEWHRPEHEEKPNSRVSSLRAQGQSIKRIWSEMQLCTPLCRSCHMKEDGRGEILQRNRPYQKGETYVPPRPCERCGKPAKPTRRGMCWTCYIKAMGIR